MKVLQCQLVGTIHTVLYIALYLLHYTDGNVGDDCEQGCGTKEECVDNLCLCDADHELSLDSDFTLTCSRVIPGHISICNNTRCNNISNCSIEDQPLALNGKCRKVKLQNIKKRCYRGELSDVVRICDYTKHQLCKSGQCICNKHYWYDPELNACDLKTNYLAKNNISEYRVKPGVYCADHNDCISGLQCSYLACACPNECKYRKKEEVCDCGSTTPAGPIAVGVIGGIIIIIFWFIKIRSTVREHFQTKKHYPVTIMMNETGVIPQSTDNPIPVCDAQVSALPHEERPPTYAEAIVDRPTRVSS